MNHTPNVPANKYALSGTLRPLGRLADSVTSILMKAFSPSCALTLACAACVKACAQVDASASARFASSSSA